METPVDDETNVTLLYDYIEKTYASVNENINRLDTKLGSIVAFDGFFIRSISDMPDHRVVTDNLPHYELLMLKCVAYGLVIGSIWVCILGLLPKPVGEIAEPHKLLYGFYKKPLEYTQNYLMKGWVQTIETLKEKAREKASKLKIGFILLAAGVSCYGFSKVMEALLV